MTNAEGAVLGLVAEKPRHGYEIERVIEERGMREWTEIGFSSIYYLLGKLEGEGRIRGSLEKGPGKGPARKVYHITDSGKEALREAVLTSLAVPVQHPSPLHLGLANLPGIPLEDSLSALAQHVRKLFGERERIEAKRRSQAPVPFFVDAMFDYSLSMISAEIDWLKKAMAQMESGKPISGSIVATGDELPEA
jgi:DNA-binding PadR family transcriptional regulator